MYAYIERGVHPSDGKMGVCLFSAHKNFSK